MAKSKKITDNEIITMYMDYVLEQVTMPKSVNKCCNMITIKEADFYENFGSLITIRKKIWNKFYVNTENLLKKNKEFNNFSNKDKMLTFFYTFFELLHMNRRYVLLTLQQEKKSFKSLEQLKGLQKQIKNFAADLINEDNTDKAIEITKQSPKLFSEGAWLQFLFILKFWMNDESVRFEKTDIVIEKSVNTCFDVYDNTTLENIIDFGKFLYKEAIV